MIHVSVDKPIFYFEDIVSRLISSKGNVFSFLSQSHKIQWQSMWLSDFRWFSDCHWKLVTFYIEICNVKVAPISFYFAKKSSVFFFCYRWSHLNLYLPTWKENNPYSLRRSSYTYLSISQYTLPFFQLALRFVHQENRTRKKGTFPWQKIQLT